MTAGPTLARTYIKGLVQHTHLPGESRHVADEQTCGSHVLTAGCLVLRWVNAR